MYAHSYVRLQPDKTFRFQLEGESVTTHKNEKKQCWPRKNQEKPRSYKMDKKSDVIYKMFIICNVHTQLCK